jgi:hypothetical protein
LPSEWRNRFQAIQVTDQPEPASFQKEESHERPDGRRLRLRPDPLLGPDR